MDPEKIEARRRIIRLRAERSAVVHGPKELKEIEDEIKQNEDYLKADDNDNA